MKWTRWAAAAALSASVLGVMVDRSDTPIEQLAQEIDAVTLARWIRSRSPHLLVNLATEPLVEIPGAITLTQAVEVLNQGGAPDTVVVYAFEGQDAWRQLLRADVKLRFLRRGAQQWYDEILAPTERRDASPEALRQFEERAQLSRYFGGIPRFVDSMPLEPSGTDEIRAAQRRGCGF